MIPLENLFLYKFLPYLRNDRSTQDTVGRTMNYHTNLEERTMVKLKQILRALKLAVGGKKPELIERIQNKLAMQNMHNDVFIYS